MQTFLRPENTKQKLAQNQGKANTYSKKGKE